MDNWKPKIGDKVYHPPRLIYQRLKRTLGIPGLFSAGYGNVGSSIYYGLGVVALAAIGLAPIALLIAGVIYIFNSLSYAEGSALIPEGGGSASFARRAFNDLAGFTSGWALMLSYIATIAISAYTIPPYLGHFWPILKEPYANTLCSMAIIMFLMFINILGVRESSRLNIIFTVIDILTQISLIVLGVIFIIWANPLALVQNMFGQGNLPTIEGFILGIALAALCFTGVETVSQLAEETRKPTKRIPVTYILMIVVVMVMFAGVSVVALGAMTPHMLADPVNGWARDPIAGIAANLPFQILRDIFEPLVAVLAATILLTATNAGLMGISRLAFSMSRHRQIPATMSKIHQRFRTPYIAIFFFCMITLLLLIPGFFSQDFFVDLGSLYVFGSLLCFAFAHLSIIGLRIFAAGVHRPFKIAGNLKIGGMELPITALLGFFATLIIWILIIVTQPFSRVVGIIWMIVGFIIYFVYRWRKRLPLVDAVEEDQDVAEFRDSKEEPSSKK
jgi:basic amino acid/polyamine antiporter, APA family